MAGRVNRRRRGRPWPKTGPACAQVAIPDGSSAGPGRLERGVSIVPVAADPGTAIAIAAGFDDPVEAVVYAVLLELIEK